MAFCPHFNTQNKHKKSTKVHPQQNRRISAHAKEIVLYSEKNHTLKKPFGLQEKSPWLPLYASDSHRFLSPSVDIMPPTHIQEGHFPACNSWFPRVEPFFCRDFLGFLFVLPILEPFFFCCRRSRHRKPAITSTFYLLCAIGSLWPNLCAIFDTNVEFIHFHRLFAHIVERNAGFIAAVSADFDWCFTWNTHFSSNFLYHSRRPLQHTNMVGNTRSAVFLQIPLCALVLDLTLCYAL